MNESRSIFLERKVMKNCKEFQIQVQVRLLELRESPPPVFSIYAREKYPRF